MDDQFIRDAHISKKADLEKEEALLFYTIYNRSGEDITRLTIADQKSISKSESFRLPENGSIGIGITAVIENDEPFLTLTVETTSGAQATSINVKDSPITVHPLNYEGDIFTFTEPED